MQFKASRTLSRGGFRKYELLQVVALKNIEVGEELFVGFSVKVMY